MNRVHSLISRGQAGDCLGPVRRLRQPKASVTVPVQVQLDGGRPERVLGL